MCEKFVKKEKNPHQKPWIVMNSRICILFLLGKQRGWWQSKENFFSSQVSDKEKKKYSPFANFIDTAVSKRDGFQNFSRLKI